MQDDCIMSIKCKRNYQGVMKRWEPGCEYWWGCDIIWVCDMGYKLGSIGIWCYYCVWVCTCISHWGYKSFNGFGKGQNGSEGTIFKGGQQLECDCENQFSLGAGGGENVVLFPLFTGPHMVI